MIFNNCIDVNNVVSYFPKDKIDEMNPKLEKMKFKLYNENDTIPLSECCPI